MMNSSQKTDCNILMKIEEDEFLKLFVHSNLKSELLKNLTIAEQVKKLGEGIELVNRELQKQIIEKHNDLILQATHSNKLESILITMNLHVQNLFANAERLKNQIVVPYQALEMHTMVLSRLHLASHILRQVNRIQQLSKRLSNTNDPIQKATILQELEQLTTDSDLTDVDAVTTELRNIRAQQQKVVKLATSLLSQGLAGENVTQTNAALQIFNNLGTIDDAVRDIVDTYLSDCEQSLKIAVDAYANKKQNVSGRINIVSSQGFRNKIWDGLEKAFSEEIFCQSKQIRFLQDILNTLNFCANKNIAKDFWERLGKAIVEEVTNSISLIRQMMETDYPKLLKLYRDMTSKLNYDSFVYSRSILEHWENLYLSSSLNRLLEPTQTMFNQDNSIPSHDTIDTLIRSITGELSIALVENCLSEKVAKNVSKCVKMFAVKTEQQLCTGTEAAQVIGGTPNVGQQLNFQLANALYYFQVRVRRMLANMRESLSSDAAEIIENSLQGLTSLTSMIIHPLIISTNSTIETIIITIHLEDWVKYQALPNNRTNIMCSPYMRELTQFLSRVNYTYLMPFEHKEVMSEKCGEVVIRCIDLMVRHSSLLRPLSQGGRLRLQADYAHLEGSLRGVYSYLFDLGKPYRLFKSMATLITLTPREIIEKQMSGSSVPHSTVLLLLFSYAGPELASPHQNANWSLAKLSTWLDEYKLESDRLNLIAGALQRYENLIRQKNMSNYDPVYPVMSAFLEYAMKVDNF